MARVNLPEGLQIRKLPLAKPPIALPKGFEFRQGGDCTALLDRGNDRYVAFFGEVGQGDLRYALKALQSWFEDGEE